MVKGIKRITKNTPPERENVYFLWQRVGDSGTLYPLLAPVYHLTRSERMPPDGFDDDYRPFPGHTADAPAQPANVITRHDGPSVAKNVGMFVVFCVLSGVAMCLTYVVYVLEPGGPGPGVYSTAWMWVFMFPYMLAFALGLDRLAGALIALNPLIYGAIGWAAWRLLRRL